MDSMQPCIKCQVQARYMADQSQPERSRYVFAYVITLKNLSEIQVQLMSRRWLITDANGKLLSVEGDGVVGKQPFISGYSEYTYTSATAIETPVGVMQGQYIMHDQQGDEFIVEVEPFSLAIPNIVN